MGKMISELIEEACIKDGAKNYEGHDYMDLVRFSEDTRHMIIYLMTPGLAIRGTA